MYIADYEARQYLTVGCVYTVLYVAIDRISLVHVLPDTSFTLWNPPPAVSLALLLIKGLRFVPVLFPAAVLADGVNYAFAMGTTPTLVMDVIVSAGYTVVAIILRPFAGPVSGFRNVRDVIWFLCIIGVGALAIAWLVCLSFLLLRVLPPERLRATVRHLWIGDVTGIVGLLPVLMTAQLGWKTWKELPSRDRLLDLGVFALALAAAAWIVFGTATSREIGFFYPLLLPMTWIAVRQGLPWCAFAILTEQVTMIAIVTRQGYSVADVANFHSFLLTFAATGLVLGAQISERRTTDLQLRQQQAELGRMARLATAGALGSTIAHEISQPLATVATYAYASRLILQSEHQEHGLLAETLSKVESEAHRAGEIVERLRDFLSNGRIRRVPLALGDLIRRVVAMLADDAKSLDVKLFIDMESVVTVAADRLQLEQVLLNLIRNGLEAAAENENERKEVVIRLRQSGGQIRVDVEDNGPGISPAIADHLFEPFATTKPGGLGLGLLLSRQIIELHSGELQYDRTHTAGTRFSFRVPLDGSTLDAG